MASSGSRNWPEHSYRPGSTEPYLRLLHVTLFVRDLDRSLKFFVDQLKFGLVMDRRFDDGGRWVAVAPPDGTAILGLIAPRRGAEEYKLIGKARQIVFVTEDVPAKFEEWSKRGVRFHHGPQAAEWGGVVATFQDIDGNTFSLVGFDQVSRELEAQRRSAAEKAEAERRDAYELEIARQVQARLFPQSLPAMRSLDYAGICIQARKVGGDYYDFLSLGHQSLGHKGPGHPGLGHQRLGLVIGDISGKGIAAALLMANLQANLRSQCAIVPEEPQELLQSVNRIFYQNTSESSYATLFFAEYDDRARRLRYANCGHLSALLLREDGSLERLESTCTVVGLFDEWDCWMGERRLFPGDAFALYTDGITEAFNPAGEEFGEQRLLEALHRHRDLPCPKMLAAIVQEVQQFSPQEQQDDITLIVAKCRQK